MPVNAVLWNIKPNLSKEKVNDCFNFFNNRPYLLKSYNNRSLFLPYIVSFIDTHIAGRI